MSVEKLETFDLGIGERLVLRQLLGAQQGNLMTVQVIQRFHADLGLTEEEVEQINVSGGGSVGMLVAPTPFTFTSWRLGKIREMLRAVDAAGTVALNQLTLFEKFLPSAPNTEDAELAEEYAALVAAKGTQDAAQAVEQAEAMVAVTPVSANTQE